MYKRQAEQRLRTKTGAHSPQTPPASIEQAIAQIRLYMTGRQIDFDGIVLDHTGVDAFRLDLYTAVRRVGWGQTTTYGALARTLGLPDARAVGQAMGRNPTPVIVPCHRVLAAGDRMGGFSAFGGTATKERLLALENVWIGGTPPLPGLLQTGS